MSSFDGTNFPDSVAILNKGFRPNHFVQGVIYNSSAISGLETELVLRGVCNASTNTGYEVDLVLGTGTAQLVRWNGPPNDFAILVSGLTTNVSFADGAVWYAQIVGTVITIKCNNAPVTTYDTSGDGLILTTGEPGMGFWNQTGSSANSTKLGWKSFLAQEI